ncbi:voltage-dependent calcium channel gamma-7 subunit-like [Uloborus diversus]|uniref:voltage-dependent calcium channel gamma-7 subunit-like n=1 Tax=Uloborus diversus TaxID=327109 RepID=UPI002409EEF6|nr:voltage-dependent calcium channel gamma-7 subunit-like [Uloborus diversus]
MKCENVDYFPKEEYSPDPNDSTMAIPYAVKRASIFVFLSCLTLLLGYLLCVLGTLCRKRPVISFASGVAFILSGLLILTGMVIYISTFKSEVGNKLRPKSSFQGPMFRYHYGYSFILAVCGLMMCELSGTFTIFLFIHWHKVDIRKKQQQHHRHHHHMHHQQHHSQHKYSTDFMEDHVPCRRHRGGGRRSSKVDTSPSSSSSRGQRRSQPQIPMSESMRDLAYYNFPPFSRDTTCNTVSTSADINREYSSREFSFEILRRTTPV